MISNVFPNKTACKTRDKSTSPAKDSNWTKSIFHFINNRYTCK